MKICHDRGLPAHSAVCGETYQERTNDDNDMAATGMAIVAMLTGLIIMVGVVFGSANTAYAATLTPADERYHVAFPYNDMEYYVGVAGLDASGNKYYCIEGGETERLCDRPHHGACLR